MRTPAKYSAPTMAGATTQKTDLSPAEVTVDLPIAPQAPALTLGAETGPHQVFLHIHNVRGAGRLETRYIYLNLVDGVAPLAQQDVYAGSLPGFGIREATQPGGAHGGVGKTTVLNITTAVAALQKAGRWDGKTLRITFVTKRAPVPGSELSIGQIGLYYR